MRSVPATVPKRAYSVIETAQLISLGRTKTWELVRTGTLPSKRLGGRVVILHDDLELFLNGLEGAR